MKVYALEHKQYGGYRGIVYNDVADTKVSKDGKYTTLIFSDGSKVKKLTRLITSIELTAKNKEEERK